MAPDDLPDTRPLTPAPQPNSARAGRLAPADRIGVPARVILGQVGEQPGPAPKHVGPPPVAVAPVPLAAPDVQ